MTKQTAVIAVDVQATFADDFPGAGLPVPGSAETVDSIREFVLLAAKEPSVAAVVVSQDWHPEHLPEHIVEPGGTPHIEHGIFARHGIAGTPGADLHPRFATEELRWAVTDKVKKGQRAPAFSAFEGVDDLGTPLLDILQRKGVERVVVIGWELANCVSATAIDSAEHGFQTAVVIELTSVLDPVALPTTLGTLHGRGVETLLSVEEGVGHLAAVTA